MAVLEKCGETVGSGHHASMLAYDGGSWLLDWSCVVLIIIWIAGVGRRGAWCDIIDQDEVSVVLFLSLLEG